MAQSRASLRIGTRGSPLALVQAHMVRSRLAAAAGLEEDAIELVVIRTSGDTIQDRTLAEEGGKGLFTKEIEEALLDGRVDLAVHSAIAGTGVIYLFEDWLRPHLERGELEPVLEPWWQSFSGPFLYYPGHRLLPAPLRAFVDFIKSAAPP